MPATERPSEPPDAGRLPHRDPGHDQHWEDDEADDVLELGPEVVNQLTRAVIGKARRETRSTARAVRIDATVVEADIRCPIDAGLAWQGTQALAREGRKLAARLRGPTRRVVDRSRRYSRRSSGETTCLIVQTPAGVPPNQLTSREAGPIPSAPSPARLLTLRRQAWAQCWVRSWSSARSNASTLARTSRSSWPAAMSTA
jgi:hypothetical protein